AAEAEAALDPVSRARSEEMELRALDRVIDLLQRRDVVEDPERAARGRDDQVVRLLVDPEVRHRRHRKVELERVPALAVVARDEDPELRSHVEQASPLGILP